MWLKRHFYKEQSDVRPEAATPLVTVTRIASHEAGETTRRGGKGDR